MKEMIKQLASHDLLQEVMEGVSIRFFRKKQQKPVSGLQPLLPLKRFIWVGWLCR